MEITKKNTKKSKVLTKLLQEQSLMKLRIQEIVLQLCNPETTTYFKQCVQLYNTETTT